MERFVFVGSVSLLVLGQLTLRRRRRHADQIVLADSSLGDVNLRVALARAYELGVRRSHFEWLLGILTAVAIVAVSVDFLLYDQPPSKDHWLTGFLVAGIFVSLIYVGVSEIRRDRRFRRVDPALHAIVSIWEWKSRASTPTERWLAAAYRKAIRDFWKTGRDPTWIAGDEALPTP